MSSDKNVLKVQIYGAEYSVRGDADAKEIKAVAEYLDNKMREVDKNVRVDSSLKVAILASLNSKDNKVSKDLMNYLEKRTTKQN